MYLKYGSYSHSIGEAVVVITKAAKFDQFGRKIGVKETWQISGMLISDSVANLTTAIRSLETAYGVNGQDLKLLNDDGSETAHKILNADTLTGVMIESFSYPQGEGAEYTTFRSYSITASAESSMIPGSGSDGTIMFSQVISIQGTGGPRKVVLETRNGPPVVQYVSQRTPIYIVQSGSAMGYVGYPPLPAPIEPQYEDFERREVRYEAPAVKSTGGFESEWRVSWTYQFSKPG